MIKSVQINKYLFIFSVIFINFQLTKIWILLSFQNAFDVVYFIFEVKCI